MTRMAIHTKKKVRCNYLIIMYIQHRTRGFRKSWMNYLLSQSDDVTLSVPLRFECLICLTCDNIKKLFPYTHKVSMVKITKEALVRSRRLNELFSLPLFTLLCHSFPCDNRWQQICIWAVIFVYSVYAGATTKWFKLENLEDSLNSN